MAKKRKAVSDEHNGKHNVSNRRTSGRKQQTDGANKTSRNSEHMLSSVTTRSAAHRQARDAVFLTTELLENILRFLSMKDLLLSQRVGQKWRAVILQSRELQQALFFLPKTSDSRWNFERIDEGKEECRVTKVKPGTALGSVNDLTPPSGESFDAAEYNPLVFRREFSSHVVDSAEGGEDVLVMPSWSLVSSHPNGSWRNMLITQPPCQIRQVRCVFPTRHPGGHVSTTEILDLRGKPSERLEDARINDVVKEGEKIMRSRKGAKVAKVIIGVDSMLFPSDDEMEQMKKHSGQLWVIDEDSLDWRVQISEDSR